jgi:copper chaperone CopZ
MENNVETSYTVAGMTCGHCASSVTEELTELVGVEKVAVDVPTGLVNVTSAAPLDIAAVKAAITEAGYELVAS